MDLKAFLALPLILLAAAAAPRSDCTEPAPDLGTIQSVSPSAAHSPAANDSTMTTESDNAPAIRQLPMGCGTPTTMPSDPSSSLRQHDDDALHGLQPGDALAPVDQPRTAPLFR